MAVPLLSVGFILPKQFYHPTIPIKVDTYSVYTDEN